MTEYDVLTPDQRLALTNRQVASLEQRRFMVAAQLDGIDAQLGVLRSARDALVAAGADDSKVTVASSRPSPPQL